MTEQRKHPAASGDFSLLMSSITLACKATAVAVKKAGIAGLYGIEGVMNVQGEKQKKLDVIANDNFVNALMVRMACRGISTPRAGPGWRGQLLMRPPALVTTERTTLAPRLARRLRRSPPPCAGC